MGARLSFELSARCYCTKLGLFMMNPIRTSTCASWSTNGPAALDKGGRVFRVFRVLPCRASMHDFRGGKRKEQFTLWVHLFTLKVYLSP